TANCQLPTANCQLPTANCQLTLSVRGAQGCQRWIPRPSVGWRLFTLATVVWWQGLLLIGDWQTIHHPIKKSSSIYLNNPSPHTVGGQ
ncbi:hypothetical protein, partial [Aeromonas dhakensis]|uniref:hypothetical protein n=1 Tax=Aeromonas dhakensis TaxID=196024 RepID=UPI001C7075D1